MFSSMEWIWLERERVLVSVASIVKGRASRSRSQIFIDAFVRDTVSFFRQDAGGCPSFLVPGRLLKKNI